MNERALITICVVLIVAIACGFIAMVAPSMRRVFWILGLSLTLLEFGSITVGVSVRAISHRYRSVNGLLGLLANAYASLAIAQYLRLKIKEPEMFPVDLHSAAENQLI